MPPFSARLDTLRRADGLGWQRVRLYASVLLVLEVAAFLILIAGTHGWIVPLEQATTTDFASFYAAGALADAGSPALAYDPPAHYAAEQQVTAPGIEYQFFFYPPVFLMLCAVFARLPYLVAFCLFIGITGCAYLLVGRAILGERGWWSFVPLLAFPAVFWTAGLGQNALMTAALFGAATLLVDRRPFIAGLLFGALCYKPHFGLLIPIALVAGDRWRAVTGAAVSAVSLLLLSSLWFGLETWRDFLSIASVSHAVYESGRIDLAAFASPFGAVMTMGGAPTVAYAVQLCATGLAALLVAVVWRRDLPLPTRAAMLAAATLVAVPVVLLYDLMLGAIAGAWLIRAGRERGFQPWEKAVLAGLFLTPLAARNIGDAWHVPLTAIAGVTLVALVAAHAARELSARRPAVSGAGRSVRDLA